MNAPALLVSAALLSLLLCAAPAGARAQVADTSEIASVPPPTPAPAPAKPSGTPGANGPKDGGKERLQERLAFLTQKLNLTPAQQQQIREILQGEMQQIKAIREDLLLGEEPQKEQIRAILAETRPKIRAILTPAQQAQMKDAMEQFRAQHPPPQQ